jgi:hypothetical protein
MPRRRAQPPRLRTIPIARLVGSEVRTLIESSLEPPARARQELLSLWESLSLNGRKAVLTAARLTAMEEGTLPEGQSVIAQDAEVSCR